MGIRITSPDFHARGSKLSRFVILSTGRSGSNLLCWALSEHPNVHSFLEPLKTVKGDVIGGQSFADWDDPIEFCERVIWNPANAGGKTTIGFKLFFAHARQKLSHMVIWDYLRERDDVKKVILIRENVIDQYLSFLRAKNSGYWHAESLKQRNVDLDVARRRYNRKIWVNPRAVRHQLDSLYAGQSWLINNFSDKNSIRIDYTAMSQDLQGVMNRVFDFLGEEPVTIATKFDPLGKTNHSAFVQNFEQIQARLMPTIYFEMLRP